MPAQAAIAVADGKATPVTHNFSVMGAVSNAGEIVGSWINRTASVLTGGAEQLKSYYKPKSNGAFSIRQATILPITETVAGVPVVTRVLKATTTYEVPANALPGERKDLRYIHGAFLAQPGIAGQLELGEPAF